MTPEFFDWLDEQPRTPTSVLVRTPAGETRSVAIGVVAQEYERRTRGEAAGSPWREIARRRRQLEAIARRLGLEQLAERIEGQAG